MTPSATVETYIESQPEDRRATPPEAREIIAYKMPAYRMAGRHAGYFGGWKKHDALDPLNADLKARFSRNAAVPTALIAAAAKAVSNP